MDFYFSGALGRRPNSICSVLPPGLKCRTRQGPQFSCLQPSELSPPQTPGVPRSDQTSLGLPPPLSPSPVSPCPALLPIKANPPPSRRQRAEPLFAGHCSGRIPGVTFLTHTGSNPGGWVIKVSSHSNMNKTLPRSALIPEPQANVPEYCGGRWQSPLWWVKISDLSLHQLRQGSNTQLGPDPKRSRTCVLHEVRRSSPCTQKAVEHCLSLMMF